MQNSSVTMCDELAVDMAVIEAPAPNDVSGGGACSCSLSPTPTQFTLCLTSTPTALTLKLRRIHFLHGIAILPENDANLDVSIEYLNDYAASEPYTYSSLSYTSRMVCSCHYCISSAFDMCFDYFFNSFKLSVK